MSVRVNVRMCKIMGTPIKLGVPTYATYANCQTLYELCRKRVSIIINLQLQISRCKLKTNKSVS